VNGLDGPQSIVGLLLEITAVARNRDCQYMPDVVQVNDRVSITVSRHFA
jgi:hypothetical protein